MRIRLIPISLCIGFAFVGRTIWANEFRIVSPSSYAETDAPNRSNGSDNIRGQQVFPASDFAGLPQSHLLLTSIAFRPDVTIIEPRTASYSSFVARFSTTSKDPPNLSFVFADNIGTDQTTVYEGPLTISTSSTGPPGGPRDFDYVIDFQNPFLYDPAKGNLLFDFEFYGQSPQPNFDFINIESTATQMVNNVAGQSMAEYRFGGVVVEFTFSPLLPGDYNRDGVVDAADYVVWRKGMGTTYTQGDYDVWRAHFGASLGRQRRGRVPSGCLRRAVVGRHPRAAFAPGRGRRVLAVRDLCIRPVCRPPCRTRAMTLSMTCPVR